VLAIVSLGFAGGAIAKEDMAKLTPNERRIEPIETTA